MLKKLVAITLAALMLINPMTAMAVSWGTITAKLKVDRAYHNVEEDVHVVETLDGTTLTISGSGTIEDFEKYGDYSKYVFEGTIQLGGETFEIYVSDVDVYDEDGNFVETKTQQVVVDVASDVAITAEKVTFGVGGASSLTVNTSGNIGLAVDADSNELVIVTEKVDIKADDSGKLTFNNNGTIATQEDIGIRGSGTIEVTNNGKISTDNDKSESWYNKDGEEQDASSLWSDVHGGGSITITNGEKGTITGYMEIGVSGEGTTATLINNGETEYFKVNAGEGATATITNNETVSIQMTNTASNGGSSSSYNADGAYAEWMWSHADANGTVISTNDGTAGRQGGATWQDGSTIIITNNNTVGSMDTYVYGDSESTITNSEGATVGGVYAEAENGSVKIDNNGAAEYVGAGVGENGEAAVTNNGTVTDAIDVGSYNGGMADIVNEGTAENIYTGAFVGATTTVTNNGTVNNELVADAYQGTIEVTNNNTVSGQLDAYAHGEGASVTVENNNTVGSSEDGNGIWVSSDEGATAAVINSGTVNGELGGGAVGNSSTAIINTEKGTAQSSWIDTFDSANVTLANQGNIEAAPVVAGDGNLTVVITTQGKEVTDTATVQALYEKSVVNDESRTGKTEIITTTPDGKPIALYSVAEDGTVVLEEILLEEEGGDGDDPRFWTKERIRHDMEEKRKAAEIGGVYGSPYWLKQLYLGYMSLNLRLFNGEEQLLFKESVTWVPNTGKAGEKVLTLNVKIEDTANLTMRLDGAVIEKLEQADIVTINIVDGAGNLFMEYAVQDLKDARAMYGLTEKEYIVVGSADADVLKIAEDGTISPIEGETEAEPVEEVADKAAEETTEEAAEETPAA